MMLTNGHHNPSLLLIDPPAGSTLNLLPGLSDYQIGHVASADEVLEFLLTHTPDAILAPVTYASQNLFETIKAKIPYPQRPLLIILSDETAGDDQADLKLVPARIGTDLKAILRLRQETLRIFAQQQTAEQQIIKLQEELANAKRIRHELEVLKNAIVRNVSHELRTPLLQIKSAVALLHEEVDEEKKTQLVALATNSTARLEVLVRNITMLGGSLETNSGPIILHDAMEAARRNLRRLWEQRDQTHRIQAEIPNTLPPVLADKQGISIVFQLLIDNALKFSQAAIYVETELVDEGQFVEVRVRDSGIGIAKDQLDRIFEIFYQVDSSSTRAYGGMGVGLAIVRLILENHHVPIKVKSELGKGSIFSFKLPVVRL